MGLEIRNLTKRYGDTIAVNDISVSLPKGQVLGLLGRNGAGKTTTIKMMLGLVQPDNGEILWNGKPFRRDGLSIGYLPEERGLYPKSKIAEQLRYFGQLEGMNRKLANERIEYWLEKFEMIEYKNKLASELSKGNQQKIQVIATLLHDPEIIILDEPFSGLDPVNATMLGTVIEELVEQNKTIILSSHRMESIELFCENVCMMKQGRIEVSGKLQKVKDDYGYKNLRITSELPLAPVFHKFNMPFEQNGTVYTAKVHNENEGMDIINAAAEAGIQLQNFSLLEPTLHQIFVERVG
ncbi:ATP-binding cassette domain-containing protein [Neobacillus notoginsengisoli]|uniref:ATP-binding cassette domain-containing protein n=1 Tax=Neobacillus notoginsengisoli TaxID=1578198 RepID=A0A417YTD7_9BACI|nr:ATP-binding cassette domain-containing protein [Neobacillus notoginsengisoli]RHW40299.1 ATP-binding cassette domain-containing protein [Neobacillus notoginsengisoli]